MLFKKSWGLLLGVMCVLCGTNTQAYETKDVMVSIGAITSPVELGSDWGEVNVEDRTLGITHDAKLGEPGVGLDLQVFYFLNPHIAVGVDLSHQLFVEERSSGWYVDGGTRQQRYLLASRIFINPRDKYKVYLAMGAGVSRTKMTIEFDPHERFTDTGFSYYCGIGVEREYGPHWSLGFEARYSGNKFDDGHVGSGGHYMRVYQKANFLSSVLRVNYKI